MAVNFIKKAPNNNIIVHSDATGSIVLVGNDSVSNAATSGEYVIGSAIRSIWAGSVSPNIWTVTKGDGSSNSVIAVLDSTGWYDYAGAGASINVEEAGTNLYFTLSGGTGYIMIDIKKILGNAP